MTDVNLQQNSMRISIDNSKGDDVEAIFLNRNLPITLNHWEQRWNRYHVGVETVAGKVSSRLN
ncbi:hypothetical protein CANARDRAFT_175474 [[Candida] arabinofermentans NRRL YB-2248]|uniref:Uncharacterized protein n=1 Tax=[Candida] arabinofermentans NRRL YB-2248 TaxID=983967 RepID=A0A1E4T1S0_9ASCO|nr:hypothetical protein CANARDRAFT_175474 [[Candida] arabinofermentans NRRL YB-2248]